MKRPASALVLVSAILVLSGCTGGKQASLEQDCVEQVAAKAGIDQSAVKIDERLKSPAGNLDWRGTYPGGEFGCAGAMDSEELFQVVTIPT